MFTPFTLDKIAIGMTYDVAKLHELLKIHHHHHGKNLSTEKIVIRSNKSHVCHTVVVQNKIKKRTFSFALNVEAKNGPST